MISGRWGRGTSDVELPIRRPVLDVAAQVALLAAVVPGHGVGLVAEVALDDEVVGALPP